MRRLVATVATVGWAAIGAACAHVEAPTGGEPIRDPLVVVATQPDTLAVVPAFRGPVVFVFDRRLSERGLDDAVLVSPRTSAVQVGHRGRELRVSLRGGWEPGRIYHVTVAPGVQDLWNNRLQQAVTNVFSTGPAIPETHVSGVAVDRITGAPEREIRVEAIRLADSLVYATRTDSAGAFVLARIPEGEYRVRAFRDLNRSRALDPFEPRDTATASVAAGDSVVLHLRVVMPDTTPPTVTGARGAERTVEVSFDDHLDPAQPLAPEQVRVTDAAGTAVPVRRLAVGRLEPAADTLAAAPPAAPGAAAPQRLPSQTLAVELAAPLAPGAEYTVRVERVRNVVGLAGGGEATFTTPAAPSAPPGLQGHGATGGRAASLAHHHPPKREP